MKTTVTRYDFYKAFKSLRPDNFTSAGLDALFNYLEDYEADTGEEMELDVIALCCDFSEYKDLAEFQQAYSTDYESLDDIAAETTVIEIDGTNGFIIQNF